MIHFLNSANDNNFIWILEVMWRDQYLYNRTLIGHLNLEGIPVLASRIPE